MNAPAPITVNPEKSAKEAITRFQEDITGKPEHQGVVNEVLSDLAQVPPSFNKGVISVASTIPKGVAILAKKLDDMTGDRSEDIEKYSTYQLGQWIEDKAKEIGIGVVDDKRAGFINSTVPMAFGQMIGMMLTGGPAAAEAGLVPESIARQTVNTLTSPMAMSGALQAAVPEYEAAKAAGQSDSEAFSVFFKNIPGGMTEVIPIANMFSRLNKVTGNGLLNALKLGTAQGFEEGSQEAVQQYLTNKIAQGTYDPKRDLREGLLEGAGAGFIVGFLMPGIMGAMENMTPEDKLDTKNIIEEYLKKQPEQTVNAPAGDLGVKPATNEKPKEQVEPVKPAEVPKVKAKESVPVQSESEVKGEEVKAVVYKPSKGEVLVDSKTGKNVFVTKVSKPAKGSALENEPFIIDVQSGDGKKMINMPLSRFEQTVKTGEPPKIEEAKSEQVAPETIVPPKVKVEEGSPKYSVDVAKLQDDGSVKRIKQEVEGKPYKKYPSLGLFSHASVDTEDYYSISEQESGIQVVKAKTKKKPNRNLMNWLPDTVAKRLSRCDGRTDCQSSEESEAEESPAEAAAEISARKEEGEYVPKDGWDKNLMKAKVCSKNRS